MEIVTDSLLGYWNSKYGVNGDVWENISPNTLGQHNGIINGATLQEDGMYFDGIDDNVKFSEGMGIITTQNFTFEAWVKFPLDAAKNLNFIINPGTTTSMSLGFESNSKKIRHSYWTTAYSVEEYPIGFLMHIVWSVNKDDNRFNLFVDNEFDSSGTFPASVRHAFNSPWQIGGHNIIYFLKGHISAVRIYGKALTAEEVSQNYEIGTNIGLEIDSPKSPPEVESIKVDNYKVSHIIGSDVSTVEFSFNKDVSEWRVVLFGTSHDTGIVLDSGGIVDSNVNIFSVIYGEDLHQEGKNRINIYGKNEDGWTPYSI